MLIILFFAFSLTSLDAKNTIHQSKNVNPICPEKCLLAYRCSPYYSNDLIWTLADGICKVFANGCIYGSEQCNRQNDCLTPMIETTKEKCQLYCATSCDALPLSPVCGWFPELSPTGTPGEKSLEFKNQCALDEWSCKYGKPYGSSNPGTCS